MNGRRFVPLALLAAALGCGGGSAGVPQGPSFDALTATIAWSSAIAVQLQARTHGADVAEVLWSAARADGSAYGPERLLLGASLGDALTGQDPVSALRLISLDGGLAPAALRLRAVDTAGRSTTATAVVARPAFGTAGATCQPPVQPCAGELACLSGRCAVTDGATAACGAATAVTWASGAAELPLPATGSAALSGTCAFGARGAETVYALTLDAAGGERLDVQVPTGAFAFLRRDCLAPAGEALCVGSAGSEQLAPGTYALVIQAGTATSGTIRLARMAL